MSYSPEKLTRWSAVFEARGVEVPDLEETLLCTRDYFAQFGPNPRFMRDPLIITLMRIMSHDKKLNWASITPVEVSLGVCAVEGRGSDVLPAPLIAHLDTMQNMVDASLGAANMHFDAGQQGRLERLEDRIVWRAHPGRERELHSQARLPRRRTQAMTIDEGIRTVNMRAYGVQPEDQLPGHEHRAEAVLATRDEPETRARLNHADYI
jgi:hypothetical protein